MNLLIGMIGLVAGLVIGDIINDIRIKEIKAEADKVRRENLSALEHEAWQRQEIERLTDANEYWKSVNERRHIL